MNQRDIFEKAYVDFGDSIFRYIYFRIFDRDIAKDLVQETFYKVWDYLAKGKEVDNMKAFLFRTAHNITVNAIRSKKAIVSLEKLEETINFDTADIQNAQAQEDMRNVQDIINSFSMFKKDETEILKMRYVDGLSIQEISSIIHTSENSISVKIHRLIQKLKEYHNPHEK